jgi:hypothetical protein
MRCPHTFVYVRFFSSSFSVCLSCALWRMAFALGVSVYGTGSPLGGLGAAVSRTICAPRRRASVVSVHVSRRRLSVAAAVARASSGSCGTGGGNGGTRFFDPFGRPAFRPGFRTFLCINIPLYCIIFKWQATPPLSLWKHVHLAYIQKRLDYGVRVRFYWKRPRLGWQRATWGTFQPRRYRHERTALTDYRLVGNRTLPSVCRTL